MKEYKLIDYFDVYGNEEDGYSVNDLCDTGHIIIITDNDTNTNENIIKQLIKIGYLSQKATTENVEIEGDDMFIELFQSYDMLPLCRLERINL